MSDIAASSLSARLAGDILALKLSLQQDRAAASLIEKVLEATQSAAAPASAPGGSRLVDIVV
jgi:hypothetical protein